MQKKELLDKLQLVSNCLGQNDFIQIFNYFCFTGKQVFCFNGTQAAVVNTNNGIKGAIPSVLLKFLTKVIDDKVETSFKEGDKNTLIFKTDKIKTTFPIIDTEEFCFDPIKILDQKLKHKITIDDEIIVGLKKCLISCVENSLEYGLPGVIFEADESFGLSLYATNDTTISNYGIPMDMDEAFKYFVPIEFIKMVIDWYSKFGKADIQFYKDSVLIEFKDGNYLYSELDNSILYDEDGKEKQDFNELIGNMYDELSNERKIPKGFKDGLERCKLFTNNDNQGILILEEDELILKSVKDYAAGKHVDKFKFKSNVKGECRINLDYLLRALPEIENFNFIDYEGQIVFVGLTTDDGFFHFIMTEKV